jgi:hypothetical protein
LLLVNVTAQIRLFTELHQHEPANVVSNILTDMSAFSRWPEIGREEVIFSRRPQKTIFPPLYGLFENGIFARGGGLGVRPVMFRGDVQRTGVEMLADLSPAPAAKYASQAANLQAAPSSGSGAAAREPGGIAFRG